MRTRHRSDIDGLRAIAVVPVLLFHAGLSGFSGGFLGVDIFFVISGFLITSILLDDAENGRFSIAGFYNRRVRRIFPALFTLLVITTIIAAILFTPLAFEEYSKSLIATTLFASNILFFRKSGYFDTVSQEKPLLHTWSLAVEEQFYLVWPLIIWAFVRLGNRRQLFYFLIVGVTISFVLAIILPFWSRSATFYLPFTRAWELGLGALLTVAPPKLRSSGVREAAAAAGLLGIVVAITLFDDQTPLALASGLACLGTALLIACNSERTKVGQLLSLPLCVGVGLISYSLYLWHWPLLAFAHYYLDGPPSAPLRIAILGLAVICAYGSYRLVERPLRRRGAPAKAFALSGVAMILMLISAASVIFFKGFPGRFAPEIARVEASLKFERPCDGCAFGARGDPELVLWGDSHAMAIMPAIRDFAVANYVPAIAFTTPACPPLIGAQPSVGGRSQMARCRMSQNQALQTIAKAHKIRTIILAARWTMASETTRFGLEQGAPYFLTDAATQAQTVSDSRRALADGLVRTVRTLARLQPKAHILLIGQAPEPGYDAAQCLIRSLSLQRLAVHCEVTPKAGLQRLAYSDFLLAKLAGEYPQVSTVFLSRELCDGYRCPTHFGDVPVYRDIDHLSQQGAKILLEGCLPRALSAASRSSGEKAAHAACRSDAIIE